MFRFRPARVPLCNVLWKLLNMYLGVADKVGTTRRARPERAPMPRRARENRCSRFEQHFVARVRTIL